uniref:Uncharacterized protein n=1 Tax=Arundo donax TaxID=35708 RepID=A0A0A8YBC7_ARUDO
MSTICWNILSFEKIVYIALLHFPDDDLHIAEVQDIPFPAVTYLAPGS